MADRLSRALVEEVASQGSESESDLINASRSSQVTPDPITPRPITPYSITRKQARQLKRRLLGYFGVEEIKTDSQVAEAIEELGFASGREAALKLADSFNGEDIYYGSTLWRGRGRILTIEKQGPRDYAVKIFLEEFDSEDIS
jgi:hypothetical protein